MRKRDLLHFRGGDVQEARAGIVNVHEHLVVAAARLFHYQIAGLLDDVEVVASAPGHRVAAGLAVEQIVARAAEQVVGTVGAGDRVVERVADQGRTGG